MVYDFSRQAQKAAGQWRQEKVWVYPLPENVGIMVDRDRQDQPRSVAPGSAADHAGLRAGDRLRALNGVPVASFGDIQYALNRAPTVGQIPVSWERAGRVMSSQLRLTPGWRKTDISWRASMRGLEPSACVYGDDLKPQEKRAFGLPANHLAFRQGDYVPKTAKAAGIRAKDIILGIDNRPLVMTMLQFNVYIRLNYKVGDRVTFNVVRDGQRLRVPMVLPAHD
jgi:S1-C subfamily serine protease